MLTAEQIIAAQKANIETLFGLTQKAFEGVEKLVELNVQATKAALAACDKVCKGECLRMGIDGCTRNGSTLQHGQIGPIIAHGGSLVPSKAEGF